MVMQAPAKFYEEQRIPIVRWMYPGKAYKARLITVPRKYNQAVMYIYVLNDKHVIAYRNENMTAEIGMLRLEHFEKISELNMEGAPAYSSVSPKALTYGELFESVTQIAENVIEIPKSITQEDESVTEKATIVTIAPPEPAVQYEQLTLF